MKRISKIFLSICMLFVISFSLVACSFFNDNTTNNNNDNNNNNNNNGGTPPTTQTYTPPTGVDMTSADAYITWLKNNLDLTLSYESEVYKINGTSIESSSKIISLYKDNTIYVEEIDEDEKTDKYYEITKIADKFKVITYSNYNLKYYEDIVTGFQLSDTLIPISMIYFFTDAVDVLFSSSIQGNSVTPTTNKTIEKLSDGKYLLTNIITYEITQNINGEDTKKSVNITIKLIVENNKLTSVEYITNDPRSSSGEESMIISYTYKDVIINFDKSQYTKYED